MKSAQELIAELSLDKSAELDQMVAGLVTFARASRAYYAELVAQGFDARQALDLTKHWQAHLLNHANGNK